MTEKNERPNAFGGMIERVGQGARNAFELMTRGRLGAPYRAPFEVVERDEVFDLRRYHPDQVAEGAPAVVMVPPLMVTSEVYDISPELSAVSYLSARGFDVWLVDYGNPLDEDGGLKRSLDDHILAVDRAVDTVTKQTGRSVHLTGYSQGGMFCYQAAAYRRADDIASLATFGSPVDIRRNLPVEIHDDVAERILRVAHRSLSGPLKQLDGLPGALTSNGFKLLNPGNELKHILSFFGSLHDREALEEREPKRQFLGGGGFIAWPGQALRDFIDEMIADNRMTSGGFVVGGRSVSLADLTMPILYITGSRDDLARPEAVRAIEGAAPAATIHGMSVDAGHFGLVVGSTAMDRVWPSVADWFDADEAERAGFAAADPTDDEAADAEASPPTTGDASSTRALYDIATDLVDGLWHRLGDVSREVGDIVDTLRWQLPRFAELENLHDRRRIGIGRALDEQARAIPEETFFLWRGRAYSYAEANERVDRLASVWVEAGIEPGDHIGLLMDNHPDYLTAVAAASRMGAHPVLLNAGMGGDSLDQALRAAEVDFLACDPAHVERAVDHVDPARCGVFRRERCQGSLPDALVDLDAAVAEAEATLPEDLQRNPGRADDLCMLIFTSGTTGLPKPARITNRRWALAALGSAAACEITPRDTVYCVLPLYHATGMLVACGGALIGGARLALSPKFNPERFWTEVRRYGATIVFYVGELCRYLVGAPEHPGEDDHPVRLFVGNGMRPDIWEQLLDRFGPVDVLEFYASTEGNVALGNLTGQKVGSVGRPLPGTDEVALVDYEVDAGRPLRDADGRLTRVDDGQPGLLVARISDDHPLSHFDGYLDEEQTERKTIRDAFEPGDAWFNTGDLLERDGDGDFWFVDRIGDTFRWSGENVSTEQVARVVRRADFVERAVVYGVEVDGREGRAGMAALVPTDPEAFDREALFGLVDRNLFPAARPRFVRLVDAIETTDSFKFLTRDLRRQGADPTAIDDPLFYLDEEAETYRPMADDDRLSELVSRRDP